MDERKKEGFGVYIQKSPPRILPPSFGLLGRNFVRRRVVLRDPRLLRRATLL